MATVTLAESAKLTQDMLLAGVIEQIVEVNPLFELFPFMEIEGNALAYNRENALAAVAAARHVGVTPAHAIASLARFTGIKRRMELRGTENGVRVYDDFAHHPTAIALTVQGLRRREAQGRILAVLEPRSNTMKLGVMKAQLPHSLSEADAVFCYANALGWDVAAALAPLGERVRTHAVLDELVAEVVAAARPGDHVLVMSNGGFGGVHQKLLDALAAVC